MDDRLVARSRQMGRYHFTLPETGWKICFAEFHPVVWMFDDEFDKVAYTYHKSDPIIENISGTYADKNAPITTETISWNHSIQQKCWTTWLSTEWK